MSRLLYTIYSNNFLHQHYKDITTVQQDYANKCNADYMVHHIKQPMSFADLQMQKLLLLESQFYNQIVYIDFDVIPLAHSKDIFSHNYNLAMLPLIRYQHSCEKMKIKNDVHRYYNTLSKSKEIIFNTGVVATTMDVIHKLRLSERYEKFKQAKTNINNEAFITWLIETYDIEYTMLPMSYNNIVDDTFHNPQYNISNFIHFSNKQFNFQQTALHTEIN